MKFGLLFLFIGILIQLPMLAMEQENPGLKRKHEETSVETNKKQKTSPSLNNFLNPHLMPGIAKNIKMPTGVSGIANPQPRRESLHPEQFDAWDKIIGRKHIQNIKANWRNIEAPQDDPQNKDALRIMKKFMEKKDFARIETPFVQKIYNRIRQAVLINDFDYIKELEKISKMYSGDVKDDLQYAFATSCAVGNLEFAQFLFNTYLVDIDAKCKDETALHYAIKNNHIHVIKWLLEQKPKLDDIYLLLDATRNGKLEIVQLLINAGMDKNAKNDFGYTAFSIAIANNQEDIVRYLISIADKSESCSLLIQALDLEAGRYDLFYDIIKNKKLEEDLDKYDPITGTYPLHAAIDTKNKEIINYILGRAKSIEIKNKQQQTPLHVACMNKLFDIVQLLVERGADVNAQDEDGFTPLLLADENLEIVTYLVSHGADIQHRNKRGENILHLAAACCSLDVVKYLIEECSVEPLKPTTGRYKKNAWQIAREHGGSDILWYAKELTIKNDSEKICLICGNDVCPENLSLSCFGCMPMVCNKCIEHLPKCPKCKRDFPK